MEPIQSIQNLFTRLTLHSPRHAAKKQGYEGLQKYLEAKGRFEDNDIRIQEMGVMLHLGHEGLELALQYGAQPELFNVALFSDIRGLEVAFRHGVPAVNKSGERTHKSTLELIATKSGSRGVNLFMDNGGAPIEDPQRREEEAGAIYRHTDETTRQRYEQAAQPLAEQQRSQINYVRRCAEGPHARPA